MVQKPEKNYVSISELAKRWVWDESDVCGLIWRGQLVPSWYFSKYDSYRVYELPSSTLLPPFFAISWGMAYMNQLLSRVFLDFCVV